jgi:hypothetical protein
VSLLRPLLLAGGGGGGGGGGGSSVSHDNLENALRYGTVLYGATVR